MPMTGFEVNDRVRLLSTTRGIPVGSAGTIQQVYLLNRDSIYEIQFDGEFRPRLIHEADVERVADTRPAERMPTTGAD